MPVGTLLALAAGPAGAQTTTDPPESLRLRMAPALNPPRSTPRITASTTDRRLALRREMSAEGTLQVRPLEAAAPSPSPSPTLPKPTAPAAALPTYVDRVLDERSMEEDLAASARAQPEPEPKGRRFLSADYKLYTRDASGAGRSLEQGMALRYRRETQDYGELYFDGEVRNYHPATFDIQPAQALKSRVTLSQYRYALTERLQMDNALGVVRNTTHPLLSSSFRIQLPSSILAGVNSVVYNANSEFRFSSGQLGQLTGVASQQFDTTRGTLTGAGYTGNINANWAGAAQFYSLSGHQTVADHQSATWATQYLSDNRATRVNLHGLHDSKGHSGLWFDADQRLGLLQNRYGAFRMAPNLLWTDALIVSDQQGAYWRSDYRTQRYTVSGGVDFTDNNIDNDAARGGTRVGNGFLSGFMRVDRTLSVNGNASVSHSNPKFTTLGSVPSTTYLANASVSKALDIGAMRLQVAHNQVDTAINPAREEILRWDQDWAISSAVQLSTTVAHTWAVNNGIASTHPTLGLLFRHYVSPTFRWDGNVNYNRVRDDVGRADNSTNAAINGIWSIARDWSAQLQFVWNRVDNTNPLAPVYTRDKTVLLMLRYESASGTPLTQIGQAGGGLGSGRITGRVFYDDNGDGVRQATEKPVAGLTVLLDGRYPTTTDNDGRFTFGPVGSGSHTISVTVERVPLPWGLLDEAPRRVSVPLRGESVVEIPLNKLNQ